MAHSHTHNQSFVYNEVLDVTQCKDTQIKFTNNKKLTNQLVMSRSSVYTHFRSCVPHC